MLSLSAVLILLLGCNQGKFVIIQSYIAPTTFCVIPWIVCIAKQGLGAVNRMVISWAFWPYMEIMQRLIDTVAISVTSFSSKKYTLPQKLWLQKQGTLIWASVISNAHLVTLFTLILNVTVTILVTRINLPTYGSAIVTYYSTLFTMGATGKNKSTVGIASPLTKVSYWFRILRLMLGSKRLSSIWLLSNSVDIYSDRDDIHTSPASKFYLPSAERFLCRLPRLLFPSVLRVSWWSCLSSRNHANILWATLIYLFKLFWFLNHIPCVAAMPSLRRFWSCCPSMRLTGFTGLHTVQ